MVTMSVQPQPTLQMTADEFWAYIETHAGRYELIDGYLRDLGALLMAGGSNNHASIALNVGRIIGNILAVRENHCRPYSADVYLWIAERTYVQPDMTVSCDEQDLARNDGISAPSLIVEVTSPSTSGYDHSQKLRLYDRIPSVMEYLLIDSQQVLVEVYHRAANGSMQYRQYGPDERITLQSINATLAVQDLYQFITFADEH